MATLVQQLNAMRQLRDNWDGYNGAPPTGEVLDLAIEFVELLETPRPGPPRRDIRVWPGRDGGVLVEWENDHSEYELEINPDGTWGFLQTDRATGEMTETRFRR